MRRSRLATAFLGALLLAAAACARPAAETVFADPGLFVGYDPPDGTMAVGEVLIVVLSTDCGHCQESVGALNALSNDERLPALVALAPQGRISRAIFRDDYGARFAVDQMDETYFEPLAGGALPAVYLLSEGRVAAEWHGSVPAADDVVARDAEARR